MRRNANENILKARALRRSMTLPEGLLWQVLRQRPGGFKFRRQHPIGPFIVDFYCPVRHLAIEVDGASHNMGDNPDRDIRRDAYLRELGLRIVRFDAADVLHNMDAVAQTILSEASV
jgi:very-short-patch-repair endonuclease